MIVKNMCDRMDSSLLALLKEWANRLEADEMIIHSDASITLLCSDGCICNHESPTLMELLAPKEYVFTQLLIEYDRESEVY